MPFSTLITYVNRAEIYFAALNSPDNTNSGLILGNPHYTTAVDHLRRLGIDFGDTRGN